VAPANATAPTVTLENATGGTTTGLSSSDPATVIVPYTNTLTEAADTVLPVDFANIAVGDVISVSTTGSVKVVTAEATGTSDLNVTTLGKSSLSITSDTVNEPGASGVFLYNTSTTAGTATIVITRTGLTSTTTLHIKGTAGLKWNVTEVTGLPAALADTKTAVVTFKITDVFGNNITASDDATMSTGVVRSSHFGAITRDSTAGVYKTTLTSASNKAFVATVDIGISYPIKTIR
jgi:hypothetical protein